MVSSAKSVVADALNTSKCWSVICTVPVEGFFNIVTVGPIPKPAVSSSRLNSPSGSTQLNFASLSPGVLLYQLVFPVIGCFPASKLFASSGNSITCALEHKANNNNRNVNILGILYKLM